MMKNTNGEQLRVNVVRFFRLNGIEYLIFSLNEIDDGGYVKLYVSKITEGFGITIEDDVEWNLIKDTIKTIIKSNKDNLPLPITDLDFNKLTDLQISDQKIFKLNDSLLQLLGANRNEETNFESKEVIEPSLEMPTMPLEEIQKMPSFYEETATIANQETAIVEQPVSTVIADNFSSTASEYALDYKTLYENELKKNEDLINEIEKLRLIISDIQKIVGDNK